MYGVTITVNGSVLSDPSQLVSSRLYDLGAVPRVLSPQAPKVLKEQTLVHTPENFEKFAAVGFAAAGEDLSEHRAEEAYARGETFDMDMTADPLNDLHHQLNN